jgi:acetolactate synthase regulatory subunit
MRLLRLDPSRPVVRPEPALIVAFDGWTDAGAGGTGAAEHLLERYPAQRIGRFDPDALFDYRDRRPELEIDRGRLRQVRWPELTIRHLAPTSGPDLLLMTGPEPDLGWRALADDMKELADMLGIRRYVGLGSVPGPLPHTRPVQLVCTSNDDALLERLGAPHEQMVVPASAQVALEAELAGHGLTTLGMWVRIPHYVAGPYPEASRALLERLSAHLGTAVDLVDMDADIEANRRRLDVAATSSDEVREHVTQLERLYDAQAVGDAGPLGIDSARGGPLTDVEVPSGDELAAEIERFLRGDS